MCERECVCVRASEDQTQRSEFAFEFEVKKARWWLQKERIKRL